MCSCSARSTGRCERRRRRWWRSRWRGATPVLIADQHRAYLSGPAEHRLFEIDYADGARVARTFDTTDAPAFVAETGR